MAGRTTANRAMRNTGQFIPGLRRAGRKQMRLVVVSEVLTNLGDLMMSARASRWTSCRLDLAN